LKAAITHFGNHGSGHYICYRQHAFKVKEEQDENEDPEMEIEAKEQPNEEQWWRISDESVYEVSGEDALRQSNVFMMFYERIDPDATPVPQSEQGLVESTTSVAAGAADAIPLPVVPGPSMGEAVFDPSAVEIPLPDDDLESLSGSPLPSAETSRPSTPLEPVASATTADMDWKPSSQRQPQSSPPTPTMQSMRGEDTEMSETDNYDSEGTPSTQMTSDDDVEMEPQMSKAVPRLVSPGLMRTAGDFASQGAEEGLRMVSAS